MTSTTAPASFPMPLDKAAYFWQLLKSTRASHQTAVLVTVSIFLFGFASRNDVDNSYLLMPFLSATPFLLALFIGLVSKASGETDLVMPRLASTAIWLILVGGLLTGPYANASTVLLGLLTCSLSVAVLAGLLLATAADRSGGKFAGDLVFPAAILVATFVVISASATSAGLLLHYLDAHYGGQAGENATRIIGRPETFLMALPAAALATIVISRASRIRLPNRLFLFPLVLFSLACFSGFITRDIDGVRELRFGGTPYLFPALLLALIWVLSLLRGVPKEKLSNILAVALGSALVVAAVINRGRGDSIWLAGIGVTGLALLWATQTKKESAA